MKSVDRAVVRVMVVDDHELVRTGLRSVLECEPDFEVVGEAGTAEEGIALVGALRPDVVLLDIRLPDSSGIDACRAMRSCSPNTKVVMLTSVATSDAVEQTIVAGAQSFLLKENSNTDLITAIRAVASGQAVLDPHVMQQILRRIRRRAADSMESLQESLTAQEQRVLAILAEGKTNKDIARVLGISEKTIRNHVYNLFQKLGVATRSEATARYLRSLNS